MEAAPAARHARVTHRWRCFFLLQEVFATIFGSVTTSNNTSW